MLNLSQIFSAHNARSALSRLGELAKAGCVVMGKGLWLRAGLKPEEYDRFHAPSSRPLGPTAHLGVVIPAPPSTHHLDNH